MALRGPARLVLVVLAPAPFREDLDILVAGCGSLSAAAQAFLYPRARVVGIDVSRTSLEHEEFLQPQAQLDQLDAPAPGRGGCRCFGRQLRFHHMQRSSSPPRGPCAGAARPGPGTQAGRRHRHHGLRQIRPPRRERAPGIISRHGRRAGRGRRADRQGYAGRAAARPSGANLPPRGGA